MIENFPFYLVAILVIIILTMIANKIKIAYPILLLLAGLGIINLKVNMGNITLL